MILWQCPHPALFVKEVCETLDTLQDHCIVSMPSRLIPNFQEELIFYCKSTRGGNYIQLHQLEKAPPLRDALAPLFSDSKASSLADLKNKWLIGASTLIVTLPDQPLFIEKEFFDFLINDLMAHAKNCRDNAETLLWNMLVIAPADRKIPSQDIGLKVFLWWGRLHNSDVEYAIEDAFRNSFGLETKKKTLDYWWLYPVCKGISRSDPDLVEMVYRNAPQGMDDLMVVLSEHELNTEENGNLVKAFLDLDNSRYKLTLNALPQGLAAKLWHKGILDLTFQGDITLHPAALLAAGYKNKLEKLIVQGQMQFFLPLVQEVHTLLWNKVEEYWGGNLEDLIPKDKNLESARDEIGPFYALLSYLYQKKGKSIPRVLHSAVKRWRQLRNDIAHIKMLSRQTIDDALTSYEEILEKR